MNIFQSKNNCIQHKINKKKIIKQLYNYIYFYLQLIQKLFLYIHIWELS